MCAADRQCSFSGLRLRKTYLQNLNASHQFPIIKMPRNWVQMCIKIIGFRVADYPPRTLIRYKCYARHLYRILLIRKKDAVAEWLRWWTRNPLGAARRGFKSPPCRLKCFHFNDSCKLQKYILFWMAAWNRFREPGQTVLNAIMLLRTTLMQYASQNCLFGFRGLTGKLSSESNRQPFAANLAALTAAPKQKNICFFFAR